MGIDQDIFIGSRPLGALGHDVPKLIGHEWFAGVRIIGADVEFLQVHPEAKVGSHFIFPLLEGGGIESFMVHIRCKHGPHHHHRGNWEKRALEDDLHVSSPVAIIDRLIAHRPDAFHFDVATATPNRIRVHEEKRTGPRAASGVDEDIRLFLAHVFDQLHQRLAFGFIFWVLIESIKFEHGDALIADKIKTHLPEPCEVGRIG